MKVPLLVLAQVGLGSEQSAQVLFSSNCRSWERQSLGDSGRFSEFIALLGKLVTVVSLVCHFVAWPFMNYFASFLRRRDCAC